MVILGGGAVSYERGTPVGRTPHTDELMAFGGLVLDYRILAGRDFFIDNLLVRIHLTVEMIGLTGLAPWEFAFSFPGNLTSCRMTFLIGRTPNTDELMTLGRLVLDHRVLAHTARPAESDGVVAGASGRRVVHWSVPHCHLPTRPSSIQGYLAHKRTPLPRTLQ